MDLQQLDKLQQVAAGFLGSWWQDDRRNWCAYCGIPMRKRAPKGAPQPPTLATRDHVIPKAHNGGLITIPSCRACNASKGAMSVPEYLDSEDFKLRRQNKHKHQWPEYALWAVAGIAALKRAAAMAPKAALHQQKPTKKATQDADLTAGRTR